MDEFVNREIEIKFALDRAGFELALHSPFFVSDA